MTSSITRVGRTAVAAIALSVGVSGAAAVVVASPANANHSATSTASTATSAPVSATRQVKAGKLRGKMTEVGWYKSKGVKHRSIEASLKLRKGNRFWIPSATNYRHGFANGEAKVRIGKHTYDALFGVDKNKRTGELQARRAGVIVFGVRKSDTRKKFRLLRATINYRVEITTEIGYSLAVAFKIPKKQVRKG